MSTGLFQDEEDGYNLEETKYKLKLGDESPAPADDALDGLEDLGGDEDLGGLEDLGSEDDKPFDEEPFDAGVEADEDEDPQTYIQQLAGKLGQSLRKYTDEQGQPDFDLEKFAINSVISATHTAEMDAEDQKDIIKKVKSSGKGEGDIDVNVDVDTDADNEDVSLDGEDLGGSEDEMDFGDETTEENFNLGEGKTPTENLDNSEKNPKFVILNKLREHNMHEIKEAPVKPAVVPETKPDVKPSRRQRPWRPSKQPKVNPKADNGKDLIMSEDGDASEGKIVNTDKLTNNDATLTVMLGGDPVTMNFDNTGNLTEKPMAYDEPWIYQFDSVDAPDGNTYSIGVEMYGHPETHLEVDKVSDDYIEKV